MASDAELLALAERVETASGADRELDATICVALGVEPQAREMLQFPAYDRSVRYFTASIDVAMTMVSEGWDWQVTSHGEDGAHAAVWAHGYHDDTVIHVHPAATPSLALCAAALRARAANMGGSDD